MNTERAIQLLYDVAIEFDVLDILQDDLKHLDENEDAILHMGMRLGLSKHDLLSGKSPVPDTVHQRFALFTHLSDWNFSKTLAGPYGSQRMLRAIFGKHYLGPKLPSKTEENELLIASVRSRCDQKVLQINELFPDTYPLHLPVWKFRISTDDFISFDKVYDMADSWEKVVQRFSELFFAAMNADLPEQDALELNLLSTFFDAVDHVMSQERITYDHILKYRSKMQEEGFKLFSSYVRIRREIPFWKAREFYKDPHYVARYIAQHEDAKSTIRSFLSKICAYECQYTFINNSAEHQYRQSLTEDKLDEYDIDRMMADNDDIPPTYITCEPILVEKSDEELTQKDRLIAERGRSFVKPTRLGGIIPTARREYSNILARRMNRLDMPMGYLKQFIGPQPAVTDADFFALGEEGDCDE